MKPVPGRNRPFGMRPPRQLALLVSLAGIATLAVYMKPARGQDGGNKSPSVNPAPSSPKSVSPQGSDDQYSIHTEVNVVTAPVTVTTRDNRYVANLAQDQFRIYDNDVEQKITGFDVSFLPISMVVCFETSGRVEGLLPKIRNTGILYTDLVLGEQGEAAIIGFDSRVQLLQDFTKDSDKIIAAVKKIKPGSDATRMSDAVFEGVRMLSHRPDNHRKVIVIVSENRNNGSEVHLGETLRNAELANILVYSIRLSTAKARIFHPAQDPPRSPFPPGVSPLPMPPGVVSTPNTQAQSNNQVFDAVPFIVEAIRGVKNLVFNDPMQLLTDGTGGKQLAPLTEGGLEESVGAIGEELRSQYLVTYRPNNLEKGGFHTIRVEVAMNGVKVRTRPGYWLGPIPREAQAQNQPQ